MAVSYFCDKQKWHADPDHPNSLLVRGFGSGMERQKTSWFKAWFSDLNHKEASSCTP
jgi:hypothetical protein